MSAFRAKTERNVEKYPFAASLRAPLRAALIAMGAAHAALAGAPAMPALDRWGFWSQDTAAMRTRSGSVEILSLGTPGQWSLGSPGALPARPGEAWTVVLRMAGRDLGWLGGGGASLACVATDSSGNVLDWQAGAQWKAGTFGWTVLSARCVAPPRCATLTPRLSGHGGGALFLSAAALEPGTGTPALPPPPDRIPSAPSPRVEIHARPDSAQGLYLPGDTLGWTLEADPAGLPPGLPYAVTGPGGDTVARGAVGPGGRIRHRPAGNGYYGLRLEASFLRGGDTLRIAARSGSAVVPRPARWVPGGNPFGFEAEDAVLARLGFTWTRPLHYNIEDGSHDRLPEDTAAYARAWRERLRKRRLPRTWLNAIEVWNEPRNELAKGWTMREFAGMVAATARGARQADPGVRIAVNWEWIHDFPEFHRAGGARHYQVASLHPYTMALFREPPHCHAFGPEADGLPEYLDRAHDSIPGKELWSTEFGWPTAPGRCWSVSELDQARYLVRSSLIQLSQGLSRVLPFSERDLPDRGPLFGSFGLRRADLTPKPSLAAYAALAQAVDALPYAGRVATGKPRTAAFLFGKGTRTVLAAWSPYGDSACALRIPAGTRETGLFGEASPRYPGSDTLRLGPSPRYFHFDAPPAKVAARLGRKLIRGRPKGLF